MTVLVTTSVVRGSYQGESHGGVYLIDLDKQTVEQKVDWNTLEIDWRGRGGDRGLRGIAFDGDLVYIAASDELLVFTPDFDHVGSWRNRYLRHCHEITTYERTLFLTSTGFDTVLGFDLDRRVFDRGFHFQTLDFRFRVQPFDPRADDGPLQLNKLHLNSIYCDSSGMYVTGTKSGGMLLFNGSEVNMSVELPPGTHNARPYREGVLFNDTNAGYLRYSSRTSQEDRALRVPRYEPRVLTHTDLDDSRLARQGFARGLCVPGGSIIAGGSSPSTVTVYDLKRSRQLISVALTMDVRNAIHGLEVWPFG